MHEYKTIQMLYNIYLTAWSPLHYDHCIKNVFGGLIGKRASGNYESVTAHIIIYDLDKVTDLPNAHAQWLFN